MSTLMIDELGTDLVLIQKRDSIERRFTFRGSVQRNKLYTPGGLDIEVGDLVEQTVPNGKIVRFDVVELHHFVPPDSFGNDDLSHIEAQIRPAQPARASARPTNQVERSIHGMHPTIIVVAAGLFADGYFKQATFEAMQAVEARVQALSGQSTSGKSLMASVFGAEPAPLDVARATGRNAQDEREGFKFLFMGAVLGIRNPRGHGTQLADSRDEAFEYLFLASALMRRLDLAESRKVASAERP